jgi:tRNA pseudouridine(38-40) synthase
MEVSTNTEVSERLSHVDFMENRHWSAVTRFWASILLEPELPEFLAGSSEEYTVTNVQSIHDVGLLEYASSDPRYKRKTFALRIGYNGHAYSGYQRQKGQDVATVEEDIYHALGERTCVAAGRTDKDVSAVSQIISFHTYDDITPDSILHDFHHKGPETTRNGSLRAYDCARVPRAFHALFSATWRRYVYLFPLNIGPYDEGYDVDVKFVNACFQQLEGRPLPYDAFAYRESRVGGEGKGSGDECTLFRTRAFVVHQSVSKAFAQNDRDDLTEAQLAQNASTSLPSSSSSLSPSASVMAVELVGTRFLRRMVRILVATAVREAVKPTSERNEHALVDIAISGNVNCLDESENLCLMHPQIEKYNSDTCTFIIYTCMRPNNVDD